MATMTVQQKAQAKINPKHDGWDDPNRKPTRTLEVFRVEAKKYAYMYSDSTPAFIADALNNGRTSYVHVIADTPNALIFEWVIVSDAPDYGYLWDYLEKRLKNYNVQRIQYV